MTKLVNRAKMTTATTGTGTITLGSAVDGYQTFADAGVVNSDVVRYVIEDGVNWEIGSGTYSAGTLTRTASESSNADAAINLSGSAVVFITATAADLVSGPSLGTVTNYELDLATGTHFDVDATVDGTISFANPSTVSEATMLLTGVGAAVGYQATSATYDSVSSSVGPFAYTAAFGDNGTKLFYQDGSTSVAMDTLSTPYDITTRTYAASSGALSGAAVTKGITFNSSGSKMYLTDIVYDVILEYTLSTNWDVTTATLNYTLSGSMNGYAYSVKFSPDGLKLYTVGTSPSDVRQYNLSTAFDLSTASYWGLLSTSGQSGANACLAFNEDGTVLFVGGTTGFIFKYVLSTAYDIQTASYSFENILLDSIGDPDLTSMEFYNNGTKFIVLDPNTDAIYQFTSSGAATAATITYPLSVKWAGGTAPSSPAIGDVDMIKFVTFDGGVSYEASVVGDAFQ